MELSRDGNLRTGRRLRELIEKQADAVIFDMDGTLIDSMGIWSDIDKAFLSERGLVEPSGFAAQVEGKSFHELAALFKELFVLPESADEIKEIWNTMAYERYAHGMKMKEGAREFLLLLRAMNKKTGIATSNSRGLTECCLRDIGIFSCFDTIVTADEVSHGKPNPDIYLKAAGNLGVNPDKCVVFEDTGAGITAGGSAGMVTCVVFDRHNALNFERNSEISCFSIKSFYDIIKE